MGMDKWTLSHIGISVKSIDQVKSYYKSLGGKNDTPTVVFDIPRLKGFETRGKKGAPPWSIKLMMLQMGPLTVELAEPIEGASYVQEHLQDHGEGADHFGYLVDDIEGELKELKTKGARILYHLKDVYAYADTREVGGMLVELIEKNVDINKLTASLGKAEVEKLVKMAAALAPSPAR